MRGYTSLEQSKKLAEFLPLESADMYWYLATKGNPKAMFNEGYNEYGDFELPCWSLAALLELIRNFQPNNQSALFVGKEDGYQYMSSVYLATHEHNNPIDVCYVMILKLYELKLL